MWRQAVLTELLIVLIDRQNLRQTNFTYKSRVLIYLLRQKHKELLTKIMLLVLTSNIMKILSENYINIQQINFSFL